ncbi:ROK family protein, partial [Streptococcus pluranimalium]|uniref:ROK family protein n=1 Tax=Streptococcus pluranimalium TaxID=82348 RepID=UPI0039FC7655
NLSTPEIFDLADKCDELASELVEKMYASLARGIYNISVSFDPDCILIDGLT